MNCQSNKYVNLVTLIVVCVIFIQMNFFLFTLLNLKGNEITNTKESTAVLHEKVIEEIQEWNLKIPKIELVAEIKDGTNEDIINNYIGHFKETEYIEGNIGLIGGCSGYKENHFSRLEELQTGDVILYQYGNDQKQYKVIKNEIINQKDWSCLSKTKENKVTLITGIQNEPEKRRCVQAIEII